MSSTYKGYTRDSIEIDNKQIIHAYLARERPFSKKQQKNKNDVKMMLYLC